jgi:hypothetical protein
VLRHQSYFGIGLEMGYPCCCIDAFLKDFCQETKERHPEGPWMGTGYIPCPVCAEQALAQGFEVFVQSHIQPRRVSPIPFPQDELEPTRWQRILWSVQYALHDVKGWVLAGLRI